MAYDLNTERDYIASKTSRDWRPVLPLDPLLVKLIPMIIQKRYYGELTELGDFPTRKEAFNAAMSALR